MGHIFTYQESKNYDKWFEKKKNRDFFEIEKKSMFEMLRPIQNATVLDIGSGTGESTNALIEKNLSVTGLEPSIYMLDIAKNKIGQKAEFIQGFAEDIPFDDNYFNYSIFFFSLEFTQNYKKALSEAFRVTKDKVFICTINKYSIYRILNYKDYKSANYLSIPKLKKTTYDLLGRVPIKYKTLPFVKNTLFSLFKKNPFAACISMTIVPLPKLKLRPMPLKTSPFNLQFLRPLQPKS